MSSLKQNVIVLSANQYSIVNRETGEISEGTSVRFALTDSLAPAEDGNLKGYKLSKASLKINDFASFTEVPGIYETELNFNVSSDGTTKLQATHFVFKKPLLAPASATK